jgi:hypothetical protein
MLAQQNTYSIEQTARNLPKQNKVDAPGNHVLSMNCSSECGNVNDYVVPPMNAPSVNDSPVQFIPS